jgi:hypothetical protein
MTMGMVPLLWMAMARAAVGVGGDGTWCGAFCGAGMEVGIVMMALGRMWVCNKGSSSRGDDNFIVVVYGGCGCPAGAHH